MFRLRGFCGVLPGGPGTALISSDQIVTGTQPTCGIDYPRGARRLTPFWGAGRFQPQNKAVLHRDRFPAAQPTKTRYMGTYSSTSYPHFVFIQHTCCMTGIGASRFVFKERSGRTTLHNTIFCIFAQTIAGLRTTLPGELRVTRYRHFRTTPLLLQPRRRPDLPPQPATNEPRHGSIFTRFCQPDKKLGIGLPSAGCPAYTVGGLDRSWIGGVAITTIGTRILRCQQRLLAGGCKQVANPTRSFYKQDVG